MANLYITPYDYKQAVTGQQILGLVGNLSRISGTLAAGGTTLNIVQATLVALNQYDEIVIFDGPNSEVVTVASPGAVIGSTRIPISPAQVSHGAGTPICSECTQGSPAAAVNKACSG